MSQKVNDVTTPGVAGNVGRSTDDKKGYNQQKKGNDLRNVLVKQTKFEGRCEGLKGHVFDCKGSGMAEQFAKTQKELAIYVGKEYKQGFEVKIGVETLTTPTLATPGNPPTNATSTETRIWEKQVDLYVKKLDQLESDVHALYSLVWGQCTDAMHAKVESATGYAAVSTSQRWY